MSRSIIITVLLVAVSLCANAQGVITNPYGERSQNNILQYLGSTTQYKTNDSQSGSIQYKTSDYLISPIKPITPSLTAPSNRFPMPLTQSLRCEAITPMPPEENMTTLRFEDAELFEIPEIALGMRYREYKDMYSAKDYVRSDDDPYDPLVAGVASFLLPGVGQMFSGEYGRGGKYMGMWAGSVILMWSGIKVLDSEHIFWKWNRSEFWHSDKVSNKDEKSDKRKDRDIAGTIMVVTGAVAGIASRALAAADAVKVSKIKNTYNRDLHRMQTYSYKVQPDILTVRTNHGRVKTLGLEVSVKF